MLKIDNLKEIGNFIFFFIFREQEARLYIAQIIKLKNTLNYVSKILTIGKSVFHFTNIATVA